MSKLSTNSLAGIIERKRLGFLLLTGFLLAGSLSACNTISGAGEDVSAAGEAIEDTAKENKPY